MMNNIIKCGLIAICALCVAACSKDTDDKLEGKWQIQQVETNGNVQKVDTFFYNFQTSLFQYQVYFQHSDTYPNRYGFKTLQGDNELALELEADNSFLKYTDWDSNKRIFTIEKLTSNQLILTSEGKRYTFRKF